MLIPYAHQLLTLSKLFLYRDLGNNYWGKIMNYKLLLSMLLLSSLISNKVNAQHDNPDIPTQTQYAQALVSALGTDGARFRQMIGALSAYCGTEQNFNTGLSGNCDLLYFDALDGNKNNIKNLLRKLRPREAVQSARTSVEIIANQQSNIASRLSELRSGIANSFASIKLNVNGENLPLEALAYLSDGSNNVDQLVSPWGFFLNGQFSNGDFNYVDATTEGYDFDSNNITAGVDYRISTNAVVGLAVGSSNYDSTSDNNSTFESSSLTYSAYGSFNFNENFYVDLKASFGKPDFDQKRQVSFTIGGNTTNETAFGTTQGSQRAFVISSGYQINMEGWQLTPMVSAEYNKTSVDDFVETNAGSFNVGFRGQEYKTERYTAGFQANKAISKSNGILIPAFSYHFVHENQFSDNVVLMRVSGMPPGEFFEAPTNFNDSNYSTAHLGLTYVKSGGQQFYIRYSRVFGWEGFDRQSFNLGARFEF